MDYKGALMKGLKEIPSSSLKLNLRQPRCKINPNWLNLPPDVMVLIMQRIDWYDVLMNVKEVCKYWHKLSKEPSVWRVIEFQKDMLVPKLRRKMSIRTYEELLDEYLREFTILSQTRINMPTSLDFMEVEDNFKRNVDKALHKMVMHAIDLSSGQLHELCLHNFGSVDMLRHIYQRSSQLRRLRLEYCVVFSNDYGKPDEYITERELIQMLKNLPLLEELQFPYTWIPLECIEVAGRCCPHLRSFISNQRVYRFTGYPESDVLALAIAKNMPTLRHLQLFGDRMTVKGLEAILSNCQHLEYLDLRQCYNLCQVLEEADFETKLRQRIKHVRFPLDSTEDYEFDDAIYDSDGTCDL